MLINLRALVVVLAVAAVVFVVAKPLCLQFMAQSDFTRRRNLWLALTVVAFLSPTFWIFMLLAMPLLYLGAREDPNPAALCLLLLHVIPPLGLPIPVVGINELFDMQLYRMLSFAVLVPAAWRLRHAPGAGQPGAPLLIDGLLLAYCVLQLVLLMPFDTFTHSVRRGFLFGIDFLLLYYVVSRTCVTRAAIAETMACFALACAIFAPLAVFEGFKGWLLYEGLGFQWDAPIPFAYLLRGDTLRAQVSAGHAIALGYMMAIAFGFCLYLRGRLQSALVRTAALVWMWSGLVAAYSRAPWLVAVLIYLAYVVLGPKAVTRPVRALLGAALLGAALLASPVGERVIDNLPFVGTVDAENVAYRQRLAERSWDLIQENPYFGSPLVMRSLEDMRQGQGIIDLVNSYASVAMFYGLVGLGLFLAPFLIVLWRAYRLARAVGSFDSELALLGASLVACMLGTLLMMATGSFGTSLEKLFYALVGLGAGYAGAVRATGAAAPAPGAHPGRHTPANAAPP